MANEAMVRKLRSLSVAKGHHKHDPGDSESCPRNLAATDQIQDASNVQRCDPATSGRTSRRKTRSSGLDLLVWVVEIDCALSTGRIPVGPGSLPNGLVDKFAVSAVSAVGWGQGTTSPAQLPMGTSGAKERCWISTDRQWPHIGQVLHGVRWEPPLPGG